VQLREWRPRRHDDEQAVDSSLTDASPAIELASLDDGDRGADGYNGTEVRAS
jgi:hypothetical protein